MPYIDPKARAELANGRLARTAGEFTFWVYRALLRYLGNMPNTYQTRAEIVAALECAKLEFYRRHVAPYEEKKIEENGDVT